MVLPGLSRLLIIRILVIWITIYVLLEGFSIRNKYIQRCFQWVIVAVFPSFVVNKAHPFTIVWSPNQPLAFSFNLHGRQLTLLADGKIWKLLLLVTNDMGCRSTIQSDRFDV